MRTLRLLRSTIEVLPFDLVFTRVIWIVLDSVGIGAMPDAAAYGDVGSDTLGNIALRRGLNLPNLARLWSVEGVVGSHP